MLTHIKTARISVGPDQDHGFGRHAFPSHSLTRFSEMTVTACSWPSLPTRQVKMSCWLAFALGVVLPLVAISTIALGYTLASWDRMARLTGVDKAEFSATFTSRKTIDTHGHGALHDLMGSSCLFLATPIVMFVPLYYGGMINPIHGQVGLAMGIALYQLWVSMWSYFGDYYFAVVQEDSPEPGTKPVEDELAWWQRQMICNKIDIVFAYVNFIGLTLVFLVYCCYSAAPVPYVGWLWLLFIATVIAKLKAGWMFAQFADDKSGDTLWWAMCVHTCWHIGGAMLAHLAIYELMTNGLSFEWRDEEQLDECDEEL
jgi:hypothetical protein